ncbi:AraC family transcriptional activator of pobA [Arcicella aurantiaca]|uniref:AraC family transcriptional activator of pobA n=1 Tax=Arcicella aurantiaca TaxID=591202 RepID=A0A316DIH2_9BACT|nr:AraC family transcriptional regulator [Arcicella aurantiaca]PWK17312.1 AraC family transcriptional activator of pobA [Arcicella aurantiaca]
MSTKVYFKGNYQKDSIDFEDGLIQVTAFPFVDSLFVREVKPHAHNFFQGFLLEEGITSLEYEENTIEIIAPAFFTIPKNIVHGLTNSEDCRGWIINLSDLFLENILRKDADIVMELDAIHIKHLREGEETEEVIVAMKKIVAEFNQNLPGKSIMLQNLVSILVVGLHRISKKNTHPLNPLHSDNTSKIYFRRFIQLIKTDYTFKKTVESFANDLGISAGHLNRICHQITNNSPKEIISNYFIQEAQKELTSIEKSITQISYQLHCDDPAYFSRLFKKRTGLTPKEYREKHGIKA